MSMPKVLTILALSIFILVGIIGFFKKSKDNSSVVNKTGLVEITIEDSVQNNIVEKTLPMLSTAEFPECNRVDEIFNLGIPKFPIVETIVYSSRVEWKKGAAWVVDYAKHYDTSRHMIARSLNKRVDYYTQNVFNGDRFNVFRKDKNINFHLLVDISRCKLGLYYYDSNEDELVLIKSYSVGLGRPDDSKISASLTPMGSYSLGDKIAVYKTNSKGYYNGEYIDMISVFGTRWIPFADEIEDCTEPSKGYGIHGSPWIKHNNEYHEDRDSIGKRESDGCIRLFSEDIEEIFAIIVSKPSYIHLVYDFNSFDLHQMAKKLI